MLKRWEPAVSPSGVIHAKSGPALADAVHAGVAAAGGDTVDLGVVPTPAVARWCSDHRVAGAMISASHNPWHDNGIKLFAAGGSKLDDATQDRIQARFDELLAETPDPIVPAPVDRHRAAVDTHIAAVVASVAGRRLDGLHVVIDAANGAASDVGPRALRELGATVTVIHAEPDGRNINEDCGSTYPASLQAAVMLTELISVLPSTGTPTGCWRSTTPGRSSTATRSSQCVHSTLRLAARWPTTPWSSR